MSNVYISKDIAELRFSSLYYETYSDDEIIKILDSIPAADVVEVVKSGQCKYWKQKDNREYGLCAKYRGIWLNSDFCSKEERKNGGQDDGTA